MGGGGWEKNAEAATPSTIKKEKKGAVVAETKQEEGKGRKK